MTAGTYTTTTTTAISTTLATVSFASTGTVSASSTLAALYDGSKSGATVTNLGAIIDTNATAGFGVDLSLGISVNNSGVISGYEAIGLDTGKKASATTVTNSGTITGTGTGVGAGIFFSSAGGTAASVTNQSTGVIQASHGVGVDVAIKGATGIVNLGTIKGGAAANGANAVGVLVQEGSVTNGSATNNSASITGYTAGIDSTNAAATTVTNWGTIAGTGTAGFAVEMTAATFADRVIDEVGSTFTGTVQGGGAASTLELASAASAGTISGLGSQFVSFGSIAVDAGSQWTLNGNNTVAGGTTLTDNGTLSFAGTLLDSGVIVVSGGTAGTLVDNGTLDVGATSGTVAATLDFAGAVSSEAITFTGSLHGVVDLTQGGNYTGISLSNFGANDTLNLLSTTYTAGDYLVYSGGTISVDNSGGTVLDQIAVTEKVGVKSFYLGSTGTATNDIQITAGAPVTYTGSAYTTLSPSISAVVTLTGEVSGSSTLGSVYEASQFTTFTNDGTVIDTAGPGIEFKGGGVVNNADTGLINGSTNGVYIKSVLASTVTNYGTIIGGTYAVDFSTAATVADRLVDEVGATFTGALVGGGAASVLELASGASIGTVSSAFSNFGTVKLDTGAQWNISSAETVASATTVTGAGALTVASGASLGIGSTLTVAGGAVLDIASGATLTDTGTIVVNGTTLDVGADLASGKLAFSGAGGTIELTNGSVYTGVSVAGLAATDTLALLSTAYAAGDTASYASGTITVKNSGGTVLDTIAGTVTYGGVHQLNVVNDGGHVAITPLDANGTYTGSYPAISNPVVANFTLTATGAVTGTSTLAAVYDKSTATLTNLGHISDISAGTASGAGVAFSVGGVLNNGSSLDTTASIHGTFQGFESINTSASDTSTVTNYGTISAGTIAGLSGTTAVSPSGILLGGGGNVINAGTGSVIFGYDGILADTASGKKSAGGALSITNSGTIEGYGVHGVGISVGAGTAPSIYIKNNATGLIESNGGLSSYGYSTNGGDAIDIAQATAATIVNLGTIEGLGNNSSYGYYTGGIALEAGNITNGSATDGSASISGYLYGISFTAAGNDTVTNFGTIGSTGTNAYSRGAFKGERIPVGAGYLGDGRVGDYAVQFVVGATRADRVIVEAGAVFNGLVQGAGAASVLELASGASTGTISGLGGYYASSYSFLGYTDFGTVTVDAGAQWDLSGSNSLTPFTAVSLSGTTTSTSAGSTSLTIAGTLTLDVGATLVDDTVITVGAGGLLVDDGSLSGTGIINITGGGTVDLTGSATATLDFTGNGVVELAGGNYAGINVENIHVGDTVALNGLAYTAGDTAYYTTHYTVNVYNGLTLIDSFAATEGGGVGGLIVVDDGGVAAVEAIAATTYAATETQISNPASAEIVNNGTVSGTYANGSVYDNQHFLRLFNYGVVSNSVADGVNFRNGGIVVNGSATDTTASITGATDGVDIIGTLGGRVTNFGTISGGTAGYAVFFTSDNTVVDRVTDEVGSKFVGNVQGGGTDSVLILASGSSAGTLSGLGSQFTKFGTLSVASKAQWSVTGSNTETGGLVDAGTLTVGAGATLNISGTESGGGSIIVGGTSSAALDLGGQASGAALSFTGTAASQIELHQGGTYTGVSVSGLGLTDTLILGSTAFAAGDYASYQAGTISVKNSGGTILDALAVAAGTTLTANADRFTLASVSGYAALELAAVASVGGIYSGSYLQIVNPGSASITVTSTGVVSAGASAPVAAVYDKATFETLTNLGTITDVGVTTGAVTAVKSPGVLFEVGGNVTNGSTSDTSAFIYGNPDGIKLAGSGTVTSMVTNYGTIETGTHVSGLTTTNISAGIQVANGVIVHNIGSAALISGYDGIVLGNTTGTGTNSIVNSGTITGTGSAGSGIYDLGKSTQNLYVLNQVGGRIVGGYHAVDVGIGAAKVNATVVNLGTIANYSSSSTAAYAGAVYFYGGDGKTFSGSVDTVVNGSATDSSALIVGYVAAVDVYDYNEDSVTITNWGTLEGTGTSSGAGYSVDMADYSGNSPDRLIFEPGAVFIGDAYGGGPVSILELASTSSVGTITGIYVGPDDTSVVGGYDNWGTILVDAGAQWDLTGQNTISSFQAEVKSTTAFTSEKMTLVNNGTLTVESGATLAFVLSYLDVAKGGTAGSLTGTGTIDVEGGLLDFSNKIEGSVANLGFVGAGGTIELTQGGTYAGINIAGIGGGDTIALLSTAYAAGDYAVLLGGTLNVYNSGGTVLDAITASESGVNTFQVVDDGGKVAIVATTLTATGTYTGSYTSITNPALANITVTSTGTVSGAATPASVYDKQQVETLTNLGSIINTANAGVEFTRGGNVLNQASGLINGATNGVVINGTGTVTNFGTIEGSSYAVVFSSNPSGADRVVDEVGSTFVGNVQGGGADSVLELASGSSAGTVSNLGVSFSNFGTIAVDGGAQWAVSGTVSGALTEASGARIVVGGSNTLTLSGTNSLSGTVSGAGTLALSGGQTTLASGSSITVSNWSIGGSALAVLGQTVNYNGGFSLNSGTVSLATYYLGLTGSAVSLSGGTINGSGTAGSFGTSGATTLAGLTIGGAATWYNSGTVTQTGGVTLGDASGLSGTIINQAAGTFDITADVGIALAVGASGTFKNAGLLEKTTTSGTSVIAAQVTDTGTVTVSTGTLDFTGTGNTFAGTIGGAGTVEFGGGSSSLGSGTSLSVANVSVTGSGTKVYVTSSLGYAGNLTQGAGTTLGLGANTLTLSGGTNSLSGTVQGTGMLALTGGQTTLASGSSITVSNWSIGGSALAVLGQTVNYAGSFSLSAGTVSTAGYYLGLTGSAVSLSGGTIDGNGTTGSFGTSGATTLAGLTIGGAATWYNSGTVTQTGGVTLGDASGLSGTIINQAAGTFDITADVGIAGANGTFKNAGLLEKTTTSGTSVIAAQVIDTGTVTVSTGTLDFTGTGNTFAGTIGGAGTVEFGGGSSSLGSGTSLSVANISLTGSGTKLSVTSSLGYAGNLTQGAGTTLALGANTLTLSGGTNSLSGTVQGTGTLAITSAATASLGAVTSISASLSLGATTFTTGAYYLTLSGSSNSFASGAVITGSVGFGTTGATALSGLTVGGGDHWYNSGTVTQTGGITVNNSAVTNQSGGVFDITGNVGISGVGSGTFTNAAGGTLEKTGGTGVSTIAIGVANSGTISVTSGTLDLSGAVTGYGSDTIGASGTLEFDSSVAAAQTVSFAASTGELILSDPSAFSGRISGFTGSDQIELSTFAYSSGTTLVWHQVNSNYGTLTVTDGSQSAVLALNGTYVTGNFSQSNVGGFTVINDPPVGHSDVVSSHEDVVSGFLSSDHAGTAGHHHGVAALEASRISGSIGDDARSAAGVTDAVTLHIH